MEKIELTKEEVKCLEWCLVVLSRKANCISPFICDNINTYYHLRRKSEAEKVINKLYRFGKDNSLLKKFNVKNAAWFSTMCKQPRIEFLKTVLKNYKLIS